MLRITFSQVKPKGVFILASVKQYCLFTAFTYARMEYLCDLRRRFLVIIVAV